MCLRGDARIVHPGRSVRDPLLVNSRNQHWRRGKKLRAIALYEVRRRSPHWHDQIEVASRELCAKIFDEWAFVLKIVKSCRVIRDFVQVNRIRRALNRLGAETCGHITPRREGMAER